MRRKKEEQEARTTRWALSSPPSTIRVTSSSCWAALSSRSPPDIVSSNSPHFKLNCSGWPMFTAWERRQRQGSQYLDKQLHPMIYLAQPIFYSPLPWQPRSQPCSLPAATSWCCSKRNCSNKFSPSWKCRHRDFEHGSERILFTVGAYIRGGLIWFLTAAGHDYCNVRNMKSVDLKQFSTEGRFRSILFKNQKIYNFPQTYGNLSAPLKHSPVKLTHTLVSGGHDPPQPQLPSAWRVHQVHLSCHLVRLLDTMRNWSSPPSYSSLAEPSPWRAQTLRWSRVDMDNRPIRKTTWCLFLIT